MAAAQLTRRRVLLETATGANRNLWATINCKHRGRAGRYEITVPENKVRLGAIQALLHESLGRPGEAEAEPIPSPATAEQVRCSFANTHSRGELAADPQIVWPRTQHSGS